MIRFIIKMIINRKRFYAKEDEKVQELVVPSEDYKELLSEEIKNIIKEE